MLIYESAANFTQFNQPSVALNNVQEEGDKFTAYFSEDGNEWKLSGAHNSPIKPLFVGIVTLRILDANPIPAQFDYFTITALP